MSRLNRCVLSSIDKIIPLHMHGFYHLMSYKFILCSHDFLFFIILVLLFFRIPVNESVIGYIE